MRSKTKQQGFRGHASTLLESIRDDCRRNEQPDIYETSYKPLLLEKSHNYRRKKIESQGLQTPPKSKSSMNNFNLSIYTDCSYRSAFTPKPRSAKSFRYVFNVNSNARKASRATHTDVDATRQLSSSISGTTPDKKTAFLMRLYIAKTKDLQITPNHKQQRIFLARLQAGIDQKQFVAPECDFGYNATQLIIKYLAKNAVEKLILDKNPLGDESMKKLAEIIPSLKLKQLSLVSINITSKSGSILLKSLIGNENLRTLNLSSPEGLNRNRINPEGFIQIASLLRHPLCCLHTLNLSNTGMGEAGFLSFLLGFQQTSHLRFKSINLAYNQISIDESQQAFATSCIGNISVERLQLQGNNLSDLGGKVLAYIIGGKYGRSVISMSIQYLDVSDNKIKLFGFQSLCNLLPINKKLTQFNANNNNLAEKDIFYAVKNLLIHTWSIKILSLKNTLPASPQSIAHHIKSLAQGLFNNKSLKQLDISESNLPENGFFMIFEALQANKTLKILKLEGCGISDSFIIKAEPIMKNCKALMQINLCNNFITDIGAKILIRILASNHDLMQMNLKKNCISLHILNDVNYQIKQNKQMIRPEDPQFMYLQYVNGLQEEQKKNIQTSISQMNSKKKYINARDLALEIVKDQEQISKKEQEIKVEKTKISKIESEIHCETLQRVKRRKKQNHNDEPQGQSVEHDTFLVTN